MAEVAERLNLIMKKLFLKTTLLFVASVVAATTSYGADAKTARPFSFWYWMYGAVNKDAIRADLQGMKDVGLQGTYLMPIRGADERPEYGGTAHQLSPAFWDAVDYAMSQADSLGLEMGIHICDGFALAGGPWFSPEESMRKVVWADTIVTVTRNGGQGARHRRAASSRTSHAASPASRNAGMLPLVSLPLPAGAKDIAAYAIPVDVTADVVEPLAMTASDNVTTNEKQLVRANEPCWFTFEFPEGTKLRNVEVFPSGTNIQCQRLTVETSVDGKAFTHLTTFVPARQGWQNTDAANTFALPQTADAKTRFYRFSWSPAGTEPGSEDLDAAKWRPTLRLKKLVFRQSPRLHQYEGKAGYVWRVAETTTAAQIPDMLCSPLESIVRVEIDAEGRLVTPLKPGTWHIIRMAHATTGHTNATGGGGKGLECDKFSVAAVNKLIDNWFARFASLPHGKAVRYLHVDSWECGCQNWSENFAAEFKARRGYDLLPWLPVMAGVPIASVADGERVLKDVRLTINDLINDVFFATVRQRAHDMGMGFSSESIAPTMVADGMDHYRYADYPMGEYWLNSPTHDKPNDMLDAISGGHIYGKNIIQAEGFTEVRGVWDETPASVKTLLDRNFALGMNRLFFHVNAHNPWLDRKPGMTLDGIGLFFQRDQTWYAEVQPFVSYITRCSALLQSGRPVQDIAVFAGEEMPRRSVLPERLVPMLPGIFGKDRVESEAKRLANVGEPIEESPVGVNHSAGIVDTRDWVNALNGYQYDSFNPDALLRLAKAEDGRMLLPGGARYRVVVLMRKNVMDPNHNGYSDAVEEKINALRHDGVIVIDEPYTSSDFSRYGLRPDVVLPKDIAYTHRTSEDGEIYFLSNQRPSDVTFTATFRETAGGTPYIYDAVRHTVCPAVLDGFDVGINLPSSGSCFVLFPKSDISSLLSVLPTAPKMLQPSASPYALPERAAVVMQGVEDAALAADRTPSSVSAITMSLRESGMTKTLARLEDWAEADDVREKFFSGHGTYSTVLRLKKKPSGNEVLSLGMVYDIAHVWVNGTDCGIVWTAPYAVNVGHALKRGDNSIVIEVVNTWANALRGMDEGTPPYSGIWTNARYRMKTPHLIPAGLHGPVILHY